MSRSNARAAAVALCDLLLGDDARAVAAGRELAARGAWPFAVALSGQWKMTPFLRERVGRLGDALGAGAPDPASGARLREMTILAAAHTALAVKRSREAFALLAHAGVEAVAIKGVALIASLYGERSLRLVGDLDLIVREDAYPAALAALAAAGYVDENPALDRHLSDITLSLRIHNVARNVVRDGFEVDVHWQFGPKPPPLFRTDVVIDRARTAALGGAAIRVAAPADAMAIAAHHSLRGYFAPHEVVKDAYDLAAWWTHKRDAWELSDVVRTADEAEVGTALYALWEFVRRRDPGHPVAGGVAALRARFGAGALREAEALAAFCEEQLACGARAERTVQLFDVGALLRSGLGRGRRMLAGAPTGDDAGASQTAKPFAARLGGAVQRVWRVVRELTRVAAYGRYRALARAQSRHH